MSTRPTMRVCAGVGARATQAAGSDPKALKSHPWRGRQQKINFSSTPKVPVLTTR
jgi:hypothetical protein